MALHIFDVLPSDDGADRRSQWASFRRGTAQYLEQKFSHTPVVVLTDTERVSPIFPVNQELSKTATILRASEGGELKDVRTNTPELHFAGGFCTSCMSRTVRQALDLNDPSQARVGITVHAHLTYEHFFGAGSDGKILQTLLAQRVGEMDPGKAKKELEKMALGMLNFQNYRTTVAVHDPVDPSQSLARVIESPEGRVFEFELMQLKHGTLPEKRLVFRFLFPKSK